MINTDEQYTKNLFFMYDLRIGQRLVFARPVTKGSRICGLGESRVSCSGAI